MGRAQDEGALPTHNSGRLVPSCPTQKAGSLSIHTQLSSVESRSLCFTALPLLPVGLCSLVISARSSGALPPASRLDTSLGLSFHLDPVAAYAAAAFSSVIAIFFPGSESAVTPIHVDAYECDDDQSSSCSAARAASRPLVQASDARGPRHQSPHDTICDDLSIRNAPLASLRPSTGTGGRGLRG
jgi:hypothetical protein